METQSRPSDSSVSLNLGKPSMTTSEAGIGPCGPAAFPYACMIAGGIAPLIPRPSPQRRSLRRKTRLSLSLRGAILTPEADCTWRRGIPKIAALLGLL